MEIRYATKKFGSKNAESERERHQGDEDVPHATLGVLRADADDRFVILIVCFRFSEIHFLLDELHGSVRAGGHGLHRGAAEPVDDGPAAYKAEQHWSVGQAQVEQFFLIEQQNDREDHGRRAHDGGAADEDGLGGRLEGVAEAESLASR